MYRKSRQRSAAALVLVAGPSAAVSGNVGQAYSSEDRIVARTNHGFTFVTPVRPNCISREAVEFGKLHP